MFSHDQGYYVFTAFIFLAVGIFHLLRLILGWEFTYVGYELPKIGSVIIILAMGYLTLRGFRASADPVSYK